MIACFIFVTFSVPSASLAQSKSASQPFDWPGAGDPKSWYAANTFNDSANDAMKDEYPVDSLKPNRVAVNKAVELYKKAIAIYPFETAYYDGLGKCYLDLGDDKNAEITYRKAIEVKEKYRGPQNKIRYPETYLTLAKLCQKHGKLKDADNNYKKACEYWKMPECYKDYAEYLKKQNRFTESAAMLKKVADMQREYDRRPKTPGAWRPATK